MDRTSGANYDESSGVRLFKDGPPGTRVEKNWLNGVQEELCHIIESSNQTLSSANSNQCMQTVGMMGFGMRNGKIIPSVAGNALTVAIKTLNGSDPSTLNPVYVRIGDNLRKITSALYITLTGGTDSWDRTSTTFPIVVYLGWATANSRVEISLCPYANYTSYPAANPAAPNAWRLESASGSNGASSLISGDVMQVCGYADSVVQSVADNYTGVTSTAMNLSDTYRFKSPQIALTVTAANWTTTRAVGIIYQTLCGVWRLKFNINGAFSAGVSQATLVVTGVVFKNAEDIAISVTQKASNAIYRGYAEKNNGNIFFLCSGVDTFFSASGDVELEAKPTI